MEWSKGMQHILDETKDVFKEEFGKNFALIDNSVSEEKK